MSNMSVFLFFNIYIFFGADVKESVARVSDARFYVKTHWIGKSWNF